MTKFSKFTQIAVKAALEAGEKILEVYNSSDGIKVEIKSDESPLTQADLLSHEVITKYLLKTKIPILSEEGSEIPYEERKLWEKLWIVDPIDGTKEFIKKNGEFTVNIALIENQKPVIGVVFAPVLNDLYVSEEGVGAYKVQTDSFNIEDIDYSKMAQLPKERQDKTYTIVASRSHKSPETTKFIDEMKEKHNGVNLISKGSSLKLCMVAEGEADCYPRFAPTMEWDTAAGQAICNHAGIDVTDVGTKKNMIYNREKLLNNWFIVK